MKRIVFEWIQMNNIKYNQINFHIPILLKLS